MLNSALQIHKKTIELGFEQKYVNDIKSFVKTIETIYYFTPTEQTVLNVAAGYEFGSGMNINFNL